MCWMLKEPLISPVQEPYRIPGLYVWISFTSKTVVLPLAACVMHTLSKPLHSFLKMHLTSYTIYDTAWCVRLGIHIPDRRTTPNAPTPPAGSPRHRPSRPVYGSFNHYHTHLFPRFHPATLRI